MGSITPDGVFTSGGTGSSGTITATAGGLTSKVSVGLENVHNDVTPEHWSYPAVEYCYEHGIVSGVSSTGVRPGPLHPPGRLRADAV